MEVTSYRESHESPEVAAQYENRRKSPRNMTIGS